MLRDLSQNLLHPIIEVLTTQRLGKQDSDCDRYSAHKVQMAITLSLSLVPYYRTNYLEPYYRPYSLQPYYRPNYLEHYYRTNYLEPYYSPYYYYYYYYYYIHLLRAIVIRHV